MDEKGESSPKEQGTPEPSKPEETEPEGLEQTVLSETDSAERDNEPILNRKPGKTEPFEALSDEETEALDQTEKTAAEAFHDPDPDWDDEEIPENLGRRKQKRWVVTGIIVAAMAALSLMLWWLFFLKDPPYPLPDALKVLRREPTPEEGSDSSVATYRTEIKKKKITETLVSGVPTQRQTVKQDQTSGHSSIRRPSDPEIRAKLAEAVTLRSELLKKQKEIRKLQQLYGERIDAVEEAILGEKQKANVNSVEEAVKIKSIEYGLRTIHRRKIYIANLNAPLDQLHNAAEELLYLERLTDIQMKMATIAKGINLETLIGKIDRSIRKHRDGLVRLTVQRYDLPSPDLAGIWKDVLRKREIRVAHPHEKEPSRLQTRINSEILAEIQKGELSRKRELTWLSQEGASTLSQWSGKVLFLNGLSSLHPSTAEILARWKGNWLCLNGLEEISPETARSLSRWQGERLSLNGLNSISRETASALSHWNGAELEMVGIAEASPEAINLLRNWGTFGKRVYFSSNLKEKRPEITK